MLSSDFAWRAWSPKRNLAVFKITGNEKQVWPLCHSHIAKSEGRTWRKRGRGSKERYKDMGKESKGNRVNNSRSLAYWELQCGRMENGMSNFFTQGVRHLNLILLFTNEVSLDKSLQPCDPDFCTCRIGLMTLCVVDVRQADRAVPDLKCELNPHWLPSSVSQRVLSLAFWLLRRKTN